MNARTARDVRQSAPRRYLALSFPFLPIDRLRITRPDLWARGEGPAVVVERLRGATRLSCVDADGHAMGLVPGMALDDARAIASDLRIFDADPHADQDWLEQLCAGCTRYTPHIAPDGIDGLTLDISDCAPEWGGDGALVADAVRRLDRQGLRLGHAIASSPQVAQALARFPGPPAPDEGAAIRRLPIAALGLDPDSMAALRHAGLRTVADLASSVSVSHFGQEVAEALDALLGQSRRAPMPRRPCAAIRIDRPLAEPIGDIGQAFALLEDMVVEAVARLTERGEGARRFEAVFFRNDGLALPLRVETRLPVNDASAILRLLIDRIGALPNPTDSHLRFDLLRFLLLQVERLPATQLALEGGGARRDRPTDPPGDHLSCRAGHARATRNLSRASLDLDQTELPLPAVTGRAPKPWEDGETTGGLTADGLTHPVHLFDPPQPISVTTPKPGGPPHQFRWRRRRHDVARFDGPTASQSHDLARTYYRVEDARGRRYWIFHGLEDAETPVPAWYLHGLFA